MNTHPGIFHRWALAALPVFCLLLPLSSTAGGQQWTRFRGPDGNGTSETANLPVAWGEGDYNWRVALPGAGNSSPVVWGDMVYVTSTTEADGRQIVICLRASDGSPVWKRDFKAYTYKQHSLNAYASSTPVVDEKGLYITWANPREYIVLALDRLSGKQLWRRDFGSTITQHGFGGSPVLFDDLIIVTKEQCEWEGDQSKKQSFIVALDRATGQTRWKAPRRTKRASYSTPGIYRPKDGPPQLILATWAHGVSSMNPTNGKTNWELDILVRRVVASPLIVGDLIFASCGSGGGGKKMVAIRAGDSNNGLKPQLAYEITGSLPYVPTCVAHAGLLFLWADSGVVTCVDVATGKEHWRERVGGNFFGSPVCAGGRLYCMSRAGEMVVLAAKDKYEPLGRVKLGDSTNSTPTISDDTMYLRTKSQLMSLGGKR